ncbi:MAG: VWA domain-containing protein [Candidatus Babeliales bacterium]
MADMLGIHWAGIDRIVYLPVVLVLLFLIVRNYWRIATVITMLADKKNQTLMFQHFSLPRYRLKIVLLCAGLLLLFLALLQPQWGKKETVIQQEGRDLLIMFDVSRSMLAQDVKPSRLALAKLKVRRLLEKLSFERVGLLIFSGTAFMQCPLTADHNAFLMFLDNLDVQTMSSGTTAIDTALVRAVSVFGSGSERKNKLALLITDGEDFSVGLGAAQYKAIQEHMTLFTLGLGTPEGAPIPKIDTSGAHVGYETDERGGVALSKLNEPLLQNICDKLHGKYVRAGYGDEDINEIARIIKTYEKEKFADKKISIFEERYPWFLGAAWFLFALEWIL